MRRVHVIGTSGSGKTSFARALAIRLSVAHVELDALHWEPGWTLPQVEDFRARVDDALAGDAWVADGNYSRVRDLVWARAEAVVFLDYSLPLILGRLARRTSVRLVTREDLWNGNRETMRDWFSRDSLLLWVLRTYRRRRREIPQLLARPEHAHLQGIRFRTPREADRWLAGVGDEWAEAGVLPVEDAIIPPTHQGGGGGE